MRVSDIVTTCLVPLVNYKMEIAKEESSTYSDPAYIDQIAKLKKPADDNLKINNETLIQGLQRHCDHVYGDGEDSGDRHIPRPARTEGGSGKAFIIYITQLRDYLKLKRNQLVQDRT